MEVSDTPLTWRKSRRSTASSGNCVEAAPVWRKSRRSAAGGTNCVEAAPATEAVAVRDSKDPDGPRLRVSGGVWRRFAGALRDGNL